MANVNKLGAVREQIEHSCLQLLKYCQARDWAGFDPYDALNSRMLGFIPLVDNRLTRIALTQINKRLPINLRPLLLVSKEQNPKAIALFLMSFVKLSRIKLLDRKELTGSMIERLIALRSPNSSYWCWGYSFPWQTRTVLVPRWAPNLVCTTFVANALLDAYETNRDAQSLDMAVSAGEYILKELYWTDGESISGFSYPVPSSRVRVVNANFLGAALLCRIYQNTGEMKFLEPALKVARYSATKQHEVGSWDYGEMPTQRWIDNFHTGYNLCALRSIGRYAETSEFEQNIRKGFEFYRRHFFKEDGAPKYYHDRTYPIDIHSVAQSIITLVNLSDLDKGNVELALSVYKWAIKNMWDKKGYFYFQKHPFYKNKISHMRWSQAWMLNSLATLLEEGFVKEINSTIGKDKSRSIPHQADDRICNSTEYKANEESDHSLFLDR